MITASRLLVGALVFAVCGGTAQAQSSGQAVAGAWEAAFGIAWIGTSPSGTIDATLTGPTGDRVRLFSTSTELASTPALDARFGRRITRVIQGEVSASYARPELQTKLSADAEGGPDAVASESLRQIAILGGVVAWLPRFASVRPFVAGGGGYLRELHEGDTLAQGGGAYYAGGGIAIALGESSRPRKVKAVGVRVDGRALFRSGPLAIDGQTHAAPALTASLFARF
jgi:hypothetical protein